MGLGASERDLGRPEGPEDRVKTRPAAGSCPDRRRLRAGAGWARVPAGPAPAGSALAGIGELCGPPPGADQHLPLSAVWVQSPWRPPAGWL